MYWLAATALAGTFAGIPIRGVPGVGEPHFINPAEGWTAPLSTGRVWVFVGEEDEQAAAWLTRHTALPPVSLQGVDEARGDGLKEVAFRRGNVAVRVQAAERVRRLAERLRDSIVGAAPSALASTWEWRSCPDMLVVDAPGAAAIQELGRVTVDRDYARLEPFPQTPVYVWDRWGRATRVWDPASASSSPP